MNNHHKFLNIMQTACDEICWFRKTLEQEDLDKQCERCPLEEELNKVMNEVS